jgi:hypothetical protein
MAISGPILAGSPMVIPIIGNADISTNAEFLMLNCDLS